MNGLMDRRVLSFQFHSECVHRSPAGGNQQLGFNISALMQRSVRACQRDSNQSDVADKGCVWLCVHARGSERLSECQQLCDLQPLFDTRQEQPLIGIHNSLANEDINIAGAEERPHADAHLTALEEHRLYCGSTWGKKCAEC